MKALTLKHPWAFAICHMGKRIENRSWMPPPRLIGHTIAIHGGMQPKARAALEDIAAVGRDLLRRFGIPEGFSDVTLQEMIMPGIVATATLSAVLRNSRDPWFDHSGYGWGLSNVMVLPSPIACGGAQGLWDVPEELVREINKANGEDAILTEAIRQALAK